MEPLEIKIKTLTPLWTGGVETGKMDRLHETGIIGSLRWWYEAIVRGLGGRACDPTQRACGYDEKKANNGLCDVCQLFGATGWRRRFALRAKDETIPVWTGGNPINRPPSRTRGWYLPPGKIGSLTLHFNGDEETLQRIQSLLLFLEGWGNLGARPQLGYGRFQITGIKNAPARLAWQTFGNRDMGALPDLRAFTFFRFQFQPRQQDWQRQVAGTRQLPRNVTTALNANHMFPTMPALKNYLRFELDWPPDLARWFFGNRSLPPPLNI